MHSAFQRLVTFVMFFLSCLFVTLAVIAASNHVFYPNRQPASFSFNLRKVELYRGIEDPYMSKPTTLADIRFDLSVDFTPIFHWNAKQVYLYVVLEYSSKAHKRNEMIVWDKIIQSPQLTGYEEGGKFAVKNARNKYPIADVSNQLTGTSGKLFVRWNTTPHIGKLGYSTKGQFNSPIPIKFEVSDKAPQ
jgi:signal peptidase complex subunit 3